jgi:hypothetical protein
MARTVQDFWFANRPDLTIMQRWLANLDFQMGRSGLVGMFRRIRTRLFGPSNRALLSRIETLTQDPDTSAVLIERLDATMRYVAEKTARDTEERIVQRVEGLLKAASSADAALPPASPNAHFDSILAASRQLDSRMTEIAAAVEALRQALEAEVRQRTDGGRNSSGDNAGDARR